MAAERTPAIQAKYSLEEYEPSADLIAELYAVFRNAHSRFSDSGLDHFIQPKIENIVPPEFSALFDDYGQPADIFALRAHETGRVIGFAVCADCDGIYWLRHMSVLRECGQKGLGRALLGAVINRANWAYYSHIGLTTFKNAPFNAPFYAKHGFMEADIEALPPVIIKQCLSESSDGTTRNTRCVMIKRL